MNCRQHPDTPLPPSRVSYGTGCYLCKREWRARRRVPRQEAPPPPVVVNLQEARDALQRAADYLVRLYHVPAPVHFGVHHKCVTQVRKWTEPSVRQAVLLLRRKIQVLDRRRKTQLKLMGLPAQSLPREVNG